MKYRIFRAALLGMSLLVSAQASIITINFDDPGMTNLVQVSNQYPNVTFSSVGGDVVLITSQNPPYLGSVPNLICTGTLGGPFPDCTHDLIVTFTNPVSNLSFGAYGNHTALGQAFGSLDISFVSGVVVTGIPLLVTHTNKCPLPAEDCYVDPVDLPYSGITQIVLHTTDEAGTAYDDFTFTQAATPNPEPSTLMLTGLCGIFWTGRRFLARKNRKNT
jgi:hypothetical protein